MGLFSRLFSNTNKTESNKFKDKFTNTKKVSSDFEFRFGKKDYSPFTFDEIQYSQNKEYCISYYGSNESSNLKGQIALIKNGFLVYIIEIRRPIKCAVSNNGYVVCCDKPFDDVLCGSFYVFNENGGQILNLKVEANIDNCVISETSKYAIFISGGSKSDDGNKLFIINVEKRTLENKVNIPMWYENEKINGDENSIVLINYDKKRIKIGFDGNPFISKRVKKDNIEKL